MKIKRGGGFRVPPPRFSFHVIENRLRVWLGGVLDSLTSSLGGITSCVSSICGSVASSFGSVSDGFLRSVSGFLCSFPSGLCGVARGFSCFTGLRLSLVQSFLGRLRCCLVYSWT